MLNKISVKIYAEPHINHTATLKLFFKGLLFFFFVLSVHTMLGQSLSGTVTDENGDPVPYANIFIKELASGTSTDFDGNFFLQLVASGEYSLVVSAIGYESKNVTAILREPVDFKVYAVLQTSSIQMEEIIVKAEKKDPAFGIIRKAIEAKDKYKYPVNSSTSEIYLRSYEKRNTTEKKKKGKKVEEEKTVNDDGSPIDPFEEMQRKLDEEMNKVNMVEMQLTMHHQKPNKYKEIRNAYSVYGRKESLYIPTLSDVNFSFYKNLVRLKGISDVPVISPISNTAILSYKYKLIEATVEEEGQLVYKIKVIPRKKGNATVSGFIYINEGLWNIRSLDLKLYKGASKAYDQFRIQQNYKKFDDLWIIEKQEFEYETKVSSRKNFVGSTVITIEDFKKDVEYDDKFFGNEISVLTKEALERDSAYWNTNRAEPLTKTQAELVAYQDSVQAWLTSDIYLDSIEADYNKVELLDIAWDGVGFRNHRKKSSLWIGPLPSLIEFKIVGGFRAGPYLDYFRRFDNGQMINTTLRATLGFSNLDFNGEYTYWMRYDPHKLADFRFRISRDFESLNFNDALVNQLRQSNYFLNDRLEVQHRFELVNGLYLRTNARYNNRSSANRFNGSTFISEIVGDAPSEDFDPYRALITTTELTYTPQQRFMTEPTRKVILGSKFPTFRFTHEKGWNDFLKSEIDYDLLELGVEHDVTLGVLGTSKYNATLGTFVNTKDVRFIDLKRFNQSNRIWVEDPLTNFNLLDTLLTTSSTYFEAHYVHHFNGALVNNIPLIKKLRVQAVAGGGFLWVNDTKVRHEEIFAGLERTFKLGARRRLRLGLYGVVGNSSITKPDAGFRFYIDIIDTWAKDWSF